MQNSIKNLNIEPQAIVNHLLKKENHNLSNLKLNKLLYLNFCYFCSFDIYLFEDKIEAWKFGPVISSIYHEFKRFGRETIKNEISVIVDDNFNVIKPDLKGYDKRLISIIDDIYDLYEDEDPWSMVNSTHEEDSPWSQYYEPGQSNEIKKEYIYQYYKNLSLDQISKFSFREPVSNEIINKYVNS